MCMVDWEKEEDKRFCQCRVGIFYSVERRCANLLVDEPGLGGYI